ncbi:hypothetical protein GUITHDRAFT_122479 [Guillardia theta CCMP2712]|uniref:Uncharacterized protein n=1 Tax=Guillardia theta (strain CCMP2712) TaxID=905079 RepID=L1I4Y7_GUITC|nr:hypothetical protein GUITHDRAFT_122479 [Guillardia theta CCMP2712]EKX31323.1 hypothetical protein GUITHDRAFT_122479 [Guillardia theta CCMP2712]|eukprot:XP_005818303.1 hypothetical protein GUITHDRAFT_122479 [Guillardia theta CCMP2712]
MEGVHLTLISDDPKLRETFAVELTADTFVKLYKARKSERDKAKPAGGRVRVTADQVEVKPELRPISRKEMEAMCGGGNTSITRVKRAMLD